MKTKIGMNMAGTTRQSTNFAVKNLMYCSSTWVGSRIKWDDTPLDLDDKGWVKSLAPGVKATKLMATTSSEHGHPTGTYHVFYKGKGTIKYGDDLRLTSSEIGHDVLNVSKYSKGFRLEITQTDPTDYLRNIRLVHESNLDYETSPIGEEWASKIKDFDTLRYVSWQCMNNNPVNTWESRPTFDHDTWHNIGVPLELIIMCARQTNTIPWIHIPHLADRNYIVKCAEFIKANYNGKFYLEPSNEYWNSGFGFTQGRYATQTGRRLFPDAENPLHAYVAHRCEEVFAVFDDVFGAVKDRVIGVVGCHVDDVRFAEGVLKELGDPKAKGLDAIGIAPYFGLAEMYTDQAGDWDLDTFFKNVFEGGVLELKRPWHIDGALNSAKAGMISHKKIADRHGIRLLGYESGEHFTSLDVQATRSLYDAANADPRMGLAYKQNLRDWQEVVGDLICLYTFIQKGRGLANHLEDLDDAVKYQAVREFMHSLEEPQPQPEPQPDDVVALTNDVVNAMIRLFTAMQRRR